MGAPENVPIIPMYPAAPPKILNVKRLAEETAEPSTSELVQPKAEDSEDEAQFQGFAQYNREYKTEITGAGTATTGTPDTLTEVKKEDPNTSTEGKPAEESRSTNGAAGGPLDSKQDVLKRTAASCRTTPQKRKLTAGVQLTSKDNKYFFPFVSFNSQDFHRLTKHSRLPYLILRWSNSRSARGSFARCRLACHVPQ